MTNMVISFSSKRMLEFDLIFFRPYLQHQHRQVGHHHETHSNTGVLEPSNMSLFALQHDHHGKPWPVCSKVGEESVWQSL
jgi:hypothetical protein